MAILAIPVELR